MRERTMGWRPALAALGLAWTALASAAAPGDSLYALEARLVDQHGASIRLDRHKGHPTVVSMFYGSCPHVCPMLVASMRRLQQSLPEADRGRVRVLFVSLDPADTPAALAAVLSKQGIAGDGWTLASTSADEVRLIAAALGVRYRQLPDGGFSHSTILTLLDVAGRPLARSERFNDPEPEFRAALAAAAAAR